MNKNYKIWTPVKIKTNKNLARPPKFYAGQVWDCIVGENIGVESDGKNSSFIRPVLIVKRFGASAFLGIDKLKKDSFGIVRQALSEYLDL